MNLIIAKNITAGVEFCKFINLNRAEWDIISVGSPVPRRYNRILVLLTYEQTKEYFDYFKSVVQPKVLNPQTDILYAI